MFLSASGRCQIDDGVGLEQWEEAGANQLRRRKAALEKLRETLLGPPKERKRVRRPWFHVTDLVPGDVLAFHLPDGAVALFRVARLDEHRVGTAPILRQLDWMKGRVPSDRTLRRLKALPEPPPNSASAMSFRVARHRKKDEDWRDAGFETVGHVAPTDDDSDYRPRAYTSWQGLSTLLTSGSASRRGQR